MSLATTPPKAKVGGAKIEAATTPQTLRPSASEAPHRLPAYQEPKPFVTARSLRSFTVSSLFACGCSYALYRLLSRTMAANDSSEADAASVLPVVPAPQKRSDVDSPLPQGTAPALPRFAAPTTFKQLSTLTSERVDPDTVRDGDVQSIAPPRPALHDEAFARFKSAWNEALDAIEYSVVALERQRRQYREAAAMAAINDAVAERFPDASVELRRE